MSWFEPLSWFRVPTCDLGYTLYVPRALPGHAAGGEVGHGPPDKTEHFLNATLSLRSGKRGRDRDEWELTYSEGRRAGREGISG